MKDFDPTLKALVDFDPASWLPFCGRPAAAATVIGLNHPPGLVDVLLRGVQGMRESSTYQAIVAEGRAEGLAKGRAEGRAEEARRFLKALGKDKFGPPDGPTKAMIDAIEDVERLEELGRRLLRVGSWEELLAAPPRRRRNGRRPAGS